MSDEQSPAPAPGRRRMAGYTPLNRPAEPETAGHDAPQAGTSQPDTVDAGTSQPDSSRPDTSQPDDAQAGTSQPDVAEAGTSQSDVPQESTEARPAAAPSAPVPVRKQRMAGAPTPKQSSPQHAQQAEEPQQPQAQQTPPASSGQATGSGAPGTAEQPAAPVRRTRMGAASAAPSSDGSTGAQSAPAPTRTRMGGAAPARTRMGAQATGTSASDQSAGATAAADSPAPTRMGGTPSDAATPPAAASSGSASSGTRMQAPAATSSGTRMQPPAAPAASGSASSGSASPAKPANSQEEAEASARPRWLRPAIRIAVLVVVVAVIVLIARWIRTFDGVQDFIATYDGHASQPDSTPEGMPWWMGWQHFLNMFFIVLIVRTGLQVRTERKPPGYWTAKQNSFFSPKGNTPKKVSLTQWLHQSLDVIWVANGLLFIVLLFTTGHWMRIVPTSWDIFPNMVSAGLQYASLDWPTEHGWIVYNALQVVAYFLTVFVAAPLAILSGIRFSTWWPAKAERLNKIYPVEWARAVHFPVMLYFVGFVVVHVFLVFFTGALENLNHMYTSRDAADWWGLIIFLASLIVVAAAWFLSRPLFTTPLAARMGKVSK